MWLKSSEIRAVYPKREDSIQRVWQIRKRPFLVSP
jgi:hypothetical protein